MAASVGSLIFLLSLSLSAPLQSVVAGRAAQPPPAPSANQPRPPAYGAATSPVPAPGPGPEPEWGYLGAVRVPRPLMKACVQTPFPAECARSLFLRVDPKRAADLRRLTEASMRVAIEAATSLAAFGYVHIGGARNGTRLRQCVQECTVRVDASAKTLHASAAAVRRGDRGEAMRLLGEAGGGLGGCWGSCARFAGEAVHVMQRRARQLKKLIAVATAILHLLTIGAILLPFP